MSINGHLPHSTTKFVKLVTRTNIYFYPKSNQVLSWEFLCYRSIFYDQFNVLSMRYKVVNHQDILLDKEPLIVYFITFLY